MSNAEQIHAALTCVIEWERQKAALKVKKAQLEQDLYIAESELFRWNMKYKALIAEEVVGNE